MKLVADTPELKPKATTESKSGSKPESKPESEDGVEHESKDDLKSVAMLELQKKLGSSPNGLTQAEAQKRLTQYGLTRSRRRRPIRC